MLRDIWVVLLFVGGLILGATLGAIYHQTASATLSNTITSRDSEIDRLNSALAAEQHRSKTEAAQTAASRHKLQHELDVLQLQLAEQTAIVARQRDLLANPEAEKQDGDADGTNPELSPPSKKEEGLVKGGDFVYHHVKLQPRNEELEIVGEMENCTDKRFSGVYFHVELFDDRQRPIETQAITINNFSPGETRPFTGYALSDRPTLVSAVRSFRITLALLIEAKE
jgi:hypothetical protein